MLSQLRPAMLALALLPVLAFALVWGIAFWFGWAWWLGLLDRWLSLIPWAGKWFAHTPDAGSGWFASLLAGTLGLFFYVLAVLVSALTFVSVFGMPVMLRHVAAVDYPQLGRLRGGSVGGSILNSVWAVLWFLVLAAVTLPLWFVPVLGWLIPPLLLGLLNARVLRYDALSEHASAAEMAALKSVPWLHWRLLGFVGAIINVVPVLWFFSTTLTGLAFIHYALAALAAGRAKTTQGTPQ
jgi:hypothetical protein